MYHRDVANEFSNGDFTLVMNRFTTAFSKLRHYTATILVATPLLIFTTFQQPVYAAVCADRASDPDGHAIVVNSSLPVVGCESTPGLIQKVLRYLSGFMAMLSILFIVIGGIRYTFSGGDSNALASAKKTILYAVIGLVLGLSVYSIMSWVISLAS